ncbi:fatty acid hydroxylase domain-containing protein 2-like isoform X2 [Tachypleus tridentatus]
MMAVYWGIGLLFTYVDTTGTPAFLLQYKIQDLSASSYPVSLKRVGEVAAQVLFNQLVVAVPVIIVCYYLKAWRGYDVSRTIPTFPRLVLELILCALINEVFFYYSHRALHHHLLFKFFHSRHHEWTSPIAISALYCHPVEHVFSNVLPTYLGPVILGSHVVTQWIWLILATPYGVFLHSGFHLPLMPSPGAHDLHHLKFVVNYGIFGILDVLHGTNHLFKKRLAYTRHIALLNKPSL